MMSTMATFRRRHALELASQLRSLVSRSPSSSFPFFFCRYSHASNLKKESLFLNFLRRDLGFSESDIVIVARRYPQHSHKRSLGNSQQVFSLLKEWVQNDDQLRKIILGHPGILALKPDNVESKLQLLKSLGLHLSELWRFMSQTPRSLNLSLHKTLVPRIRYFQSILQGNANFLKLLKRNSTLLLYSTEKCVIPLVKFLSKSGIEGHLLIRLTNRNSRIFSASIDSMKSYIEFVRKMDIEEPSERFVDALSSVFSARSVQKMEEKFRLLESIGLHRDDVVNIFRNFPKAFETSNEKIYRIVEYLTQVIGFYPDVLVRYPNLLTYSLERRIKPRYEVFKYLRGIDPSYDNSKLIRLLIISTEKFISHHVKPSPDAEALLKVLDIKTGSR